MHKGDMNMKNKSVIALMLAFTMCFTSVCPALAAENTAVESEEVNESNPEEVSEENAAPAEETASVTQEAAEADEEMNDASSDKQEEPVEVEEAADVTEQNTGVTADAAEENEDIYDEAADTAVAEAATEEYSKKAGEAAAEPEFAPVSGNEEGQTVVPGNSGDDSPEDLFEKYMSVEFGLSDNSSMRKSKKITGTRLEGNDLAVYQEVAKELPAIAEGERASTVFELTPEVFGYEKTEWTAEELGVASIYEADGTVSKQASAAALAKTAYDLDKVTTALLADFPFELYWFDKTAGCSAPYSWYTNFVDGEYVYGITNISIRFSVAGEFSGSDAYTVKTDIGQSLQDAVNNVNTIIEQYSGASDEDKLLSYKEEICERVSYNVDAAAGNFDFNYGNPWQLLWVFDNDVETKVVCEGYSKAFKYLCDRSSFDSNITCILVTGTMAGGTGAGGHMWNIVKLGDGLNYLADVTNCDDGSVGSPDKLFLVRTEDLDTNGEIETGYTFHFDGSSVAYSYDEDTLNYYNQNEISLGELQHVHDLIKTEAKDATCTEAGNIEYWTCSECEKLFSDEEGTTEITAADTVVPAKGHSLEKTEAKEATCTEAGNTEYWTCSVCNKLFGDDQGTTEIMAADTVVAAKGHSLEKTEAKDATCTEAGNTEYWTCSECKKLFGDDQGTREITAADTVVAATGHDWGEWTVVKEATEEEEGLEERTCSNDNSHREERTITKLNHVHDLVKIDAVDATCTEAGNTEYWICIECKKLFGDGAGTTEITAEDTVIAAKGHSLEKTEAKDATCTEAGNTEYWTCSECKKLFGDDQGTTEITAADTVVAAKGHSLEKTEAKDATCTEAGNTEYWTCSVCKKLFGDDQGTTEITAADTVVAAKGHSLEKTEAKDATCTEAGNTEYWTCSECKKLFGDDQGTTEITAADTVVAAKGHSLEKTDAKDATCTEAGNTEYWTCSECKKLFGDDLGTTEITAADTVVAATGHNWGEWTVVKAATEEEEGLERRTCSNDESHTEEKTIPKLNHVHELVKTDAVAATCTEAGNIEYWTCSKCKKLYKDSEGTQEITEADTVVAAKGHSLEKTEAKDATCTEAGNTEYWTCSECKKLFGDDQGTREITAADTVVAATGHDWGEWTVVKAATEEEEGLERRTCSNDESHTEEKTIPKLNHVHNLVKTDAVDASCTEAGNIDYWTCSKCNKLYKDSAGTQEITAADTVVAAKGHSLEKTEAKAATCTEAGNIEYWTCNVCKKLFSDGEGTTEIIEAETVVAAKGHSLEKTEAKDATCTEAGNTEYWTCSVCKKLFGDDQGTTEITAADTVVAAKGHSLEKTEAVDATCTEAGNIEYWTCSKCNKLYKDSEGTQEITEADTAVAAKGHNWTEWTVVTKATEEKEGLETRICLNDESHKEERTIPKLQGKWKKNNKGWWYDRGDGSYPAGEFETIKGKTYYFNESGYMLTGWQKISGEWYYFSAGGAMLTDWQKINDKWYYFSASGAMQTDWQNINGTWYYFSAGGAMQTGWQKINGTWYYFSAGGAMQTGWQKIDGKWYYFGAGGAMQTGWQKINGTWYYFSAGGAMQTGWQSIGGKWYYFSAGGAMQTGWKNINGTWYYMEESGAMAVNKWVGNYYLTGSGAMAKNTWIGNYYVGADGKWIPGYGTSTSSSGSSSSGSSSSGSSGIVYWVKGGSVYHSTDRCPALGRSDPSTIEHGTIAESGKSRPCKDCH